MDENYILKEGCITSPMLDEHSTATIVEKTVNVSDIGEFVVGEMNSSVITFKMNRYYDGVDLSQKDILIMYKNTNGVYKDKTVNIQYSTDGLKFSWIVPNDATKTIKITAYVCFISDYYLWKTKNFTISFNPSFDVTDTEHTTNWFVSLESELIKINKKIDEIAEWARQPEKPTYTYEEVGAEKAGTSEKNLEKSKSYTDEEVRKVKEEVLPEKIKDVETFVSTQIQDANKMYFIENRYDITYDKITSIINGNKIPYFYDDDNVYIYYGRKDETYEFYSAIGDKISKRVLSLDNNWDYDVFISFKPIKSNNLNDVGINGYCYLHSYDDLSDFNFPEKADKTKVSLLISYYDGGEGNQFLYNGSNVFVRYGYPEMGYIIYNDWIELTSSSPTMYIHVTSEEKDGKTVYKSDKTYEEINEAVDSGKSPIVVYNNVLFNLYEGSNTETTFVGDRGIFIYDKDDGILFIPKSNMIQVDITVQDTGETVIACNDKNIGMSSQAMQIYQTGIMFVANVKNNKNNKQYNLFLQLVGGERPIWSTITTVGDKLMRCTLCIGDPSNTSTWEYTETEIISNNSVTIPNIYITITRNDNGTYTSSLTFDDIKSKITDQYQVYAIYTVDNTEYILNLEEVSQYVCVFRNESYEIQILQNRCKVYNFITPLTCQLTYKADKTEELIMDDRLKYCSQAYTYLRSCRTVNMSINKEGSDETIKTILQVQSVDITGGTLIGQVLVNNDVYFYKLGLESGISDASWWTLTTKKLSDNFTPLKTQVTT